MQDAQLFTQLSRIIHKKPSQDSLSTINQDMKSIQLLLNTVKFIVEDSTNQNQQSINKCFIMLNEQRGCRIPVQLAMQNLKEIQFIVCQSKKVSEIKQGRRAFAIMGRVLSVFKRKKKTEYCEEEQVRQQLKEQFQHIIFRLYHQDKLILTKNESHLLEDIQLKFDLLDTTFDPAYFGNEVYSPCIGVPRGIVMILPCKLPKPENINFLKGSLLHVYLDFANVVEKISHKQNFYKNSILRGIYFIEQGEVQVNSGRIVARGWIINGKCRSSGYGWRFKPLYFIKFISSNINIWKHFYNDAILNEQYPFKLTNIFDLDQKQQQFLSINNNNKKGIKLPKINSLSFSLDKYQQIQKMRHYDDKISNLCIFKKNLLEKKIGANIGQSLNIMGLNYQNNKQIRRIQIQSEKNSMSKKVSLNRHSTNSDNILIMSVLKKLENVVSNTPYQYKNSNSKLGLLVQGSGRKNMKINPIQLQDKIKWGQKIKNDILI